MMTPKWMSSLFCSAGKGCAVGSHGPILAVIRSGDLEVFVDSLEFTFEQPIASFTDPEVGFGVVFVERASCFEPLIRDLPESGVRHEVEVNVGGLRWPPGSAVADLQRQCARPRPERPSTGEPPRRRSPELLERSGLVGDDHDIGLGLENGTPGPGSELVAVLRRIRSDLK